MSDEMVKRTHSSSSSQLELTSSPNAYLQGFYEEVATPLLTDVTMVYIGGANVTQTNFSQHYNGSEIVVAGEITDNDIETFHPQVVALSVRPRQQCSLAHQLDHSACILLKEFPSVGSIFCSSSGLLLPEFSEIKSTMESLMQTASSKNCGYFA